MATLSNSGLVKLAAGKVVSDDATITAADYDAWIEEAESQLLAETGVEWVSVFSDIGVVQKKILESAATAWAAVNAVRSDTRRFPSSGYALDQVNINLDRWDRAIAKLKDTNVSKIFGGNQESS